MYTHIVTCTHSHRSVVMRISAASAAAARVDHMAQGCRVHQMGANYSIILHIYV